jgi:hypothetical protein
MGLSREEHVELVADTPPPKEGSDSQLFGPHSLRAQLGSSPEGLVQEANEDDGPDGEQGPKDALSDFLVTMSRPVDKGVLQPPLPTQASPDPEASRTNNTMETGKQSTRLAAKPSAGWTTMEKVQLVMLKKSGMLLEDSSPQAADLQRYRKIYSKPLPPQFVKAVMALVETNTGAKLLPAELSLLAA